MYSEESREHSTAIHGQLLDLEAEVLELMQPFPRVQGFWTRWRSLHQGFLRKLSKVTPENSTTEEYFDGEIRRFLRIRAALVSSTLQYFHSSRGKNLDEASLLASLFRKSDKIWMEAIALEIRRLRLALAASEQMRRVIGAYSGKR